MLVIVLQHDILPIALHGLLHPGIQHSVSDGMLQLRDGTLHLAGSPPPRLPPG